MLRDYFGEVSTGRLAPVPFLMRWLLLLALFFAMGLGVGAAIGVTERLAGADVQEVQKALAENLGGPFAIALLLLMLVMVFAMLNIMAKRARDVGLPGWLTAIIIGGLSGAVSNLTGSGVSGGLGIVLVLILAFLPSNWARRGG